MNILKNDLSRLTCLPTILFDKLIQKSKKCICHYLFESINGTKEITDMDIGIGTLYIKKSENEILYKFVPAPDLEKEMKSVFSGSEDPLLLEVEKSFINQIRTSYKELF